MQVPLVDLKVQYASIKPEIDAAMQRVLDNSNFILGKEVADFENAFAKYVGAQEAIGVASGTAALLLALQACGVGAGDEVITTAHTFIATAEAISQAGATPVFVDIEPLTYNIDPNQVEDAITERTRAIIPVHLYGQPCAIEPLMDIAHRHGLWLIEDAAQAHGAEYQNRRCGSIGHLGCFSFYPGKNLGAYGDAGMVTTNDSALAARVRRLRDHGRSSKYEHLEIGWGERLDALQAAVLGIKLRHLEAWTEARRAHAADYDRLLAGLNVITPHVAAHVRHVYHLYVIRVAQRDKVLADLKARGIGAGVHYPLPLHLQPAYASLGYTAGSLPMTEQAAAEVLSLPMYPELTTEQVAYVINALEQVLQ